MVKQTLLLFGLGFVMALALPTRAQYLPVNAKGKCEVSDVALAEGFAQSTLFTNEVKWAQALTREDGSKLIDATKDSLQGKVSGQYEFTVYAQSGVFKKMSGTISYYFVVESKDGKYRYTFTDFIYHYYKQNRQYKMAPTGLTKPLEETEASGWQKTWNQHRKTVAQVIKDQVDSLKTQIIQTATPAATKTPEKKIDW